MGNQEVETVTFMSYNPTGLDSTFKCRFLSNICEENDVDFVSVQEHMKFTANTDQYFRQKLPEFYQYVIPAHRSPGQDSGRAKAGLAQLIRKGIKIKKERIISHGYRVQAQILSLPSTRVLWLNTYLPTDPQLRGEYDDSILREVLGEVEGILASSTYDDVIWGSDLNWDMSRTSYFARTLSNFVEKTGLVSLWSSHPVPYTHVHTDNRSRSTIDHFLLSPRLISLVADCGIVERGDNLSRHCPIWVRLKLGSLPLRHSAGTWLPRKTSWSKASIAQIDSYTATLQSSLLSLPIPGAVWCTDIHCNSSDHCHDRDKMVLGILDKIVKACHSTLPQQGGRWVGGRNGKQGKSIPRWVEDVEPLRKLSLYWGGVWRKEGRPSIGWLHDTYVRHRSVYHHAVRKARASNDKVKAEKLLTAALQGDLALLKVMKNIKKGRGGPPELPDTVAGGSGEEEIVEKFRLVYSTLYNSAGSEAELRVLSDKVQALITPEAVDEVARVTGSTVKEAVCYMMKGKSDVSNSFTSDALLHAPDILFEQLSIVFRSWITHGNITPALLACSFLPLLKSSLKDPADTGSYRAIAGSSLILKVFERVILLLWGHLLESDSLQFGFKAKTSTTQCTWLVSEVVQHLLRSGTNPIVTVLDCTKAFDLCKFSILFTRILEKGVPPIVVRCLMSMYEDQHAWVKWGHAKSEKFTIKNGTRQGAILSPVFWAVYCDLMIKELRHLGVGAHVAGMFMGVACYADDVVLIAPCHQAMQLMLSTVEDFARRYNISFSTDPNPRKSKSKCILMIGKKRGMRKPPPLVLCGHDLPWVENAVHLGHELHESGLMDYDTVIKRAQFINKSVEIRNMFHWAAPADVLRALKTYCSSFYGCLLWDLSGSKALQVYSAWDTCVKLTWGCPRWTRTFLLQQVLNSSETSARTDILSRYGKFSKNLRESVSKEIRVLFNLVSRDLQTTTARNLRFVEDLSGTDVWTVSPGKLKQELDRNQFVDISPQDYWRVSYLGSLLQQREEAKHLGLEDRFKMLQELIDSLAR